MAQLDSTKRYVKSPNSRASDLTVEQLLHGNDHTCQSPTTPVFGKNHDQEEDQDQHTKKSVLTKVKEKAKKWKNTLIKKKQDHDNNTTPEWGVSFDDDHEDEEEDSEYYGAPMYESELASEDCKEMARQHPKADPIISENRVLVLSSTPKEQECREENTSKTITESVTEKLGPAYAMASEATHKITSKIQELAIATSAALAPRDDETSSNDVKWDKGVSVKEYLVQKLEPGEEERALSKVISEAMTPKEELGDIGMVEKMKGAVSSLLGREEESKMSMTKNTSSTNLPVSMNAYEVVEEENEGRILQAN